MAQERIQPANKKISVARREQLLWEASRRYMRGQITEAELEKIDRSTADHSKSGASLPTENQTVENQTEPYKS